MIAAMRRWPAAMIVAMGCVTALAACHNPGEAEVDERYQLQAERRTFKANVPLPEVDPRDRSALVSMPKGFLEEYHRRGRTPMHVRPAGVRSAADGEAFRVLVDWLHDQGIETVMHAPAQSTEGHGFRHVELSFEAYVAMVPQCGDWSGTTGFNPTNRHHTNFGCAMNRNIGLMLSDPGDLIEGRMPGGADPARQTVVIQKFRLGEPTESAPSGGTEDEGMNE
ncbi:CpaD family pilus assembly lipoprotein [uncultured Rhodospira sp.]|uniref:CpaD family pilus assembly protein n=1 Tax=uncultured Rhodospira sp. TaxID=1936189 RepID=UPI00260ECF66|nr:CpaD family pilus assembly lipoprotein [uncultured Rhodospira sp.]